MPLAGFFIAQETIVKEPQVSLGLAKDHGLTEEEYTSILKQIGRIPNFTELGMYSVMWSEHCSYKNSLHYLKKLPNSGERTLTKAGEENAGAIDIGDGLAVVFKVESHNHPSAIEPYQGAATGVGGIMRDIFTMGARPIASLNSLRFGHPGHPQSRHHLRGVVKGIGDYGNCLGVPTVAGETYFDDIYRVNPLVNAMVVGVARHKDLTFSRATGKGNPVMLVGATTGRDGIHGASFASQDISAESEEKRSAVQVGDPFMEKLLIEATLELLGKDFIVGIQDMGAAGLSCCTSEMSGKSGHGMSIDLNKVPVRESGMSAYEIMLSESQERMLVVVKKGFEEQAQAIVRKWELNAEIIGEVTDDGQLCVHYNGENKACIPSASLIVGGGAPVYQREYREPADLKAKQTLDINSLQIEHSLKEDFHTLIQSPNLASKFPVFNQYDYQVGLTAIEAPGGDAAVLRLHDFQSHKGLATTIDCNGRYVYIDPSKGASLAVAEAARNISCVGATPLGVTNCLNFANPYIPENYFYFVKAVEAMGDTCRYFGLPITGGNVSFYNESPEGPVYPTPTIGMVGLLENIDDHASMRYARDGMKLLLVGWFRPSFGGSEYLKIIHNQINGDIPFLDLQQERLLQTFLQKHINQNSIRVAHDLADGGVMQALCELAFASNLGFSVRISDEIVQEPAAIPQDDQRKTRLLLFGETASTVILAIPADRLSAVQEYLSNSGIPFFDIGSLHSSDEIVVRSSDNSTILRESLQEIKKLWSDGLKPYFDIKQD